MLLRAGVHLPVCGWGWLGACSTSSLCESFREVFNGVAVFPASAEFFNSSSVSANADQLTGGRFVVFPLPDVFHPVEKSCGIAGFAIEHDGEATASSSSALSIARKFSRVDASVGILHDCGGGDSLVSSVHCFRSCSCWSAASYPTIENISILWGTGDSVPREPPAQGTLSPVSPLAYGIEVRKAYGTGAKPHVEK